MKKKEIINKKINNNKKKNYKFILRMIKIKKN